MNVHRLKTWPQFWPVLEDGRKNFEIRRNDRDFQPGDLLILEEWVPSDERDPSAGGWYTGRSLMRRIAYTSTWDQKDGVIVLALSTDIT
jgi:hypothetical protein